MQTYILQIHNEAILADLRKMEANHDISLSINDIKLINSGTPITENELKELINSAENGNFFTLEESKNNWLNRIQK